MTKKSEIYGIRSVIEAIKSSSDIDKVFIQKGLKGNLIGQLESLIRKIKLIFLRSSRKTESAFKKSSRSNCKNFTGKVL